MGSTSRFGRIIGLGGLSLAVALGLLAVPVLPAQAAVTVITPGSALTARVSTPGEVANFSFVVGNGQHLSFDFRAATWSGTGVASLYLFSPDGGYRGRVNASNDATFAEVNVTRGYAGTWSAVLDPDDANTGAVTFTLAKDVDGGALTPQQAVTTAIGYRGQQAAYRFEVLGGEHLTFDIKKATWSGSQQATI